VQGLSRLESHLSCWPDDVGYGEIYFYGGQFMPSRLIPKCEYTLRPVCACDCAYDAAHPATLLLDVAA
jgi:hypothetical protein